jgi:hypothetical protein
MGYKKPIEGFSFPLLDTLVIVACFLADHGIFAWRAGLTIIASKQDGLGEPVKVSHLLGKDSYDILLSTAQPILDCGFRYLQDSALPVISNNINAKDTQQECLLVPRKAFIKCLHPAVPEILHDEASRPRQRTPESSY